MKCTCCKEVPDMEITHNQRGKRISENICKECLADYVEVLLEDLFADIRIKNLEE